jgi:hypothetical protein
MVGINVCDQRMANLNRELGRWELKTAFRRMLASFSIAHSRRFAAGDSVITRKMGVPVIKMYEYSVQDQELLGQPATVCD